MSSSASHPDAVAALNIDFTDVDAAVASADYLTLHARATGTPIIGAERFAAMKNTAFLISTARGSLLDEAALDVLDIEPMIDDYPLRGFDNVWITSLAGQTVEVRERVGLVAAQAVIDVLDGMTPVRLVV